MSFAKSSTLPLCYGITTSPISSYGPSTLGAHEMIDLSGGHFVMGTFMHSDKAKALYSGSTPHWVFVDRFSIGKKLINEEQYARIMCVYDKNKPASSFRPVRNLTYNDAMAYVTKCGNGLKLPTEAQWEYAARGPALEMRHTMEKETGRFTANDFIDFAKGRFENFVTGVLDTPLNPSGLEFQKVLLSGMPFYGWRVFPTRSGKTEQVQEFSGQENYHGLMDIGRGVEIVQDWYFEEIHKLPYSNPVYLTPSNERVAKGGVWNDGRMLDIGYRWIMDPLVDILSLRVAAPYNGRR